MNKKYLNLPWYTVKTLKAAEALKEARAKERADTGKIFGHYNRSIRPKNGTRNGHLRVQTKT